MQSGPESEWSWAGSPGGILPGPAGPALPGITKEPIWSLRGRARVQVESPGCCMIMLGHYGSCVGPSRLVVW